MFAEVWNVPRVRIIIFTYRVVRTTDALHFSPLAKYAPTLIPGPNPILCSYYVRRSSFVRLDMFAAFIIFARQY